ncbi:proline-, glutamic acid- and leucine-rich protein 1-like [Panonychus citri]|uniref:proline-, glutamic acid- and leucine-rich protein 1-like n=1 Tax=Panonychus citri TaxID=50023 RepID=UPI0023074D27|nr:proline-, glutamic acid- and leucine-rich protein 1-like [Panonychus citri]
MADFLSQVFHSSVPFNQTIQLINQNRNFKSIYNRDNKYHDTFQSHINSLLSSPTRRVHGFLLIQEYLMEMPNELLGENFKNWASFCVSYIEGSNWTGKNIALKLLDKLLLVGHNDDNTRRKLSLHIVSQIVEYICRNNYIIEKCDSALVYKVLLTCVTKYPGSCGSKKNIINTFISKNIQSCNSGFQILVSILANIHYCPTPGQSNATAKNSWFDHFCSVIDNMNSILDRFSSWGVPFESLKLTNKKLPTLLNSHEKENFIGRMKLEQSYKALALAACKMLQDPCTTGYLVPVTCILQLISRASLVKLDVLYVKDPCLALTILSIQMHSLSVLEQLISVLRKVLIIHSKLIYASLIGIMEIATNTSDSLQKSITLTTSSSPAVMSKLCIFDLKNHCYRILNQWFTVTGPNIMIDKDSADSLFKHFMMDMKLGQKQIELRNIKKDKSGKNSDAALSTPFIKDKLNSLHFNCLKASNSFVKNCFMFLPLDQVTFFATFVLEEVLSLYRYSISSSLFYGKPETRKELISLIVLLSQEDETIPIGITLNLLQKALNIDSSSLIREFCLESLRSLNGIVNPMKILRINETSATNPFTYEDTENDENVLNEHEIVTTESSGPEEEKNQEKEKTEELTEKPPEEPIEGNSDKAQITPTCQTNGDTHEVETDADDELEGFDNLDEDTKTTDVIMIQEDSKEIDDSPGNGDCIVYDVESGDTVKTSKSDTGDKDDDLEIVSVKSGVNAVKRDSDIVITSPSKRSRIVQEDSQSSSRSLTIIEVPTTIIHEIGESSGEMISDSDIIKDFIAD